MNNSASSPDRCPRSQRRLCAAVAAIAIALLLPEGAAALDPSRALTQTIHRIWQAQQGLPQGTIYCIYQTRDRYLWLGTKTGLVRFDGVQFTVIRDAGDVSLENLWVRQLLEDREGTLWIATDGGGVIRWRGDEAVRFSIENGLPSNNIRCLEIDQENHVWIGTDRGAARLVSDQVEPIDAEGIGHDTVRALCETSDGRIWIAAGGNRLHVKQGDDFSTVTLKGVGESATITALAPAADGSVWVGSSQGLVQIEKDRQSRYTTADGLANDQVFCLTPGDNDSLWIGTGDGFSRFRDGEFQSFRTTDGLSQSSVYTICEDHEGSLWVGTKLGLNQFVDRRTIPFTTSEGLPSDNTGPIEQDRDGAIWIGTLDAGLARWNGTRFSKLTTADGLPSDSIYSLAASPDGSLWVGTNQGLCRIKDKNITETLTIDAGLPSGDIRALYCDQQGTLWIGTSSGLVSWQAGEIVEPSLPKDFSNRQSIAAIVGLNSTTIVAATSGGALLKCKDGDWSLLDMQEALPSNITSLFFDGKTLYATTSGDGLYAFDEERTVHLSVREGLYDDQLFGMTTDHLGRIWVACSKGVFSIQQSDVDEFAAGKINTVSTTPLSPLDALRTVECQEGVDPTVKRMYDGRLWFSTIRGVLVIDPSHWQRVLPPTSVVVEEVVINGKSENPREKQRIPPGNANLTIRYAALSYTSPSRITFRYRLEGFDQHWIDAGARREAFYTNIPPGDYRFVVAATNADGKLYETETPVNLKISPHWYQAVWFLPMCAVTAALAVLVAYRLRVRAIRHKMNAIVIERSRIARELHDGLMQGFAGITMEMQALSSRLPEESSERQSLDDIIGDAGNCLREARRSIAGLRGTPSGLALAIQQTAQQLAQTHDMRLRLQLDPIAGHLSAETEYNLLRIAQEAITNALVHSGGSAVDVALENSANEVRLIVRDDGDGFTETTAGTPHLGHYGLIGMRERARQIGAKLDLHSVSGQGTTIRVVLPTNSVVTHPIA